jgi:hypothetical protein
VSGVKFWTLNELDGETPVDPGALCRRVEDENDAGEATVRYEIYMGAGRWEDRSPQLVWLTMNPTHGDATRIDAAHARDLMDRWPTPHTRPAFRPGYVRRRSAKPPPSRPRFLPFRPNRTLTVRGSRPRDMT